MLGEIQRVTEPIERTPHERYLEIYKLLEQRDERIGELFNDLKRSRVDAGAHARGRAAER